MARNKYAVRVGYDGHIDEKEVEADIVNVMPGVVVFLQVPQVETPNPADQEPSIVYAVPTVRLVDLKEMPA